MVLSITDEQLNKELSMLEIPYGNKTALKLDIKSLGPSELLAKYLHNNLSKAALAENNTHSQITKYLLKLVSNLDPDSYQDSIKSYHQYCIKNMINPIDYDKILT